MPFSVIESDSISPNMDHFLVGQVSPAESFGFPQPAQALYRSEHDSRDSVLYADFLDILNGCGGGFPLHTPAPRLPSPLPEEQCTPPPLWSCSSAASLLSPAQSFQSSVTSAAAAAPTAAESRTNLLVRYLHHHVDDRRLREFFSRFGTIVSSIVQRDIHTGESRGFGFVRYASPAQAERAMAESNGSVLCGKTINVLWANKQHDDTPAGEDRLRMNKLFLRNIPLNASKNDVGLLLSAFGTVERVNFRWDTAPVQDPSLVRRIAFVTFAEPGAAERALQAVHNTCPFPGCDGVPLMAKLSEDYSNKRKPTSPTMAAAVALTPAAQSAAAAPQAPLVYYYVIPVTATTHDASFLPSTTSLGWAY